MTPYESYLNAEHKINEGLIRLGLSLERPEGYVRNPQRRMDEMRGFLDDCGNPQRGIPAVHVAGTSGKGSVSAAVAGILWEAGLKIGLHISPYLQSATEKIWVDGSFVGPNEFADLVDWVMPIASPRVRPETPASIHGMASVAIALEGFRRRKLDAMVFEAGCGARYDLTSFVETSVAVVTNVGLDHVVSLGPEIERIAWHKAGVARPGVPLVTGATGSSLDVIAEEAAAVDCPLIQVPPTCDPLAHNRSIAIQVATRMADQLGVVLNEDIISRGLGRVKLAGRTEIMPGSSTRVIMDGAHNREKLAVAVESAVSGWAEGRKVALVGFLGAKANDELVEPLAGRFDLAVATEPVVYGKTPFPARETARLLERAGYDSQAIPNPDRALDRAVELAGKDGLVLVCGSFYLAGNLRERWYTKQEVVEGRSSWPE